MHAHTHRQKHSHSLESGSILALFHLLCLQSTTNSALNRFFNINCLCPEIGGAWRYVVGSRDIATTTYAHLVVCAYVYRPTNTCYAICAYSGCSLYIFSFQSFDRVTDRQIYMHYCTHCKSLWMKASATSCCLHPKRQNSMFQKYVTIASKKAIAHYSTTAAIMTHLHFCQG